MKQILQLARWSGVGVAAVLSCGTLIAWIGGPHVFGADLLGLTSLAEEMQRREELTARDQEVFQSLQAKTAIMRRVAEGKMTLLQAAEGFSRLRADQQDSEQPRRFAHLSTELDGACRGVIRWASNSLIGDPELRQRVLTRLEKERRQLQKRPRGAL